MAPMVMNLTPAAQPATQQQQQQPESFQHLVPAQRGIKLSMLIDFLLQKTYHDLSVLSELLPRKSDIDRKIEIIQFATKARQQFVRVLALVKWASGADRVDKCQAISSYLDQQNAYFIDTADSLSRIARETLVQARLPNFSLPTAVDVLTTGTFNRLPKCIKTKIVPEEPINIKDKTETLKRLNEVIQHRLVVSKLPSQFTNIKIGEGRLRLRVEHEFEVILMLMGDEKAIPWRLLNIEFLMEDYETGDGKPLVHGIQIHYMHQILQSRLMVEDEPLVDLYKTLHYFCLSLQLEVLHTQTKRLIGQRWGDFVSVDEYLPGKKLKISFCRQPSTSTSSKVTNPSMNITSTEDQSSLIVNLDHVSKTFDETSGGIILPCRCLSIEKIYSVMFKQYAILKLQSLHTKLIVGVYYKHACTIDVTEPCVKIKPFDGGENVLITVDSRSGLLLMKIKEKIKPAFLQQLQRLLETDVKKFSEKFHELRCQLYLERSRRSVMLQPVHTHDQLPISNYENHALIKLPKTKLYLRFKRHPEYCLVAVVDLTEDEKKSVYEKYYLMKLVPANTVKKEDSNTKTSNTATDSEDLLTSFSFVAEPLVKLKVQMFATKTFKRKEISNSFGIRKRKEWEAFNTCDVPQENSASQDVDVNNQGMLEKAKDKLTKKLKTEDGESTVVEEEPDTSPPCNSFNQSLLDVVSGSYLRIPFINVSQQLSKAKVLFDGVFMNESRSYALNLLDIPLLDGCRLDIHNELKEHLLLASLTFDYEMTSWLATYTFTKPKLTCAKELIHEQVTFTYEHDVAKDIAGCILSGWKQLVKVYQHAHDMDASLMSLTKLSNVENLRLLKYDMKELLFSYTKDYMVKFSYDGSASRYTIQFLETGTSSQKCPHHLTQPQLVNELNSHENLQYILKIIHDTYTPLKAVSNISILPALRISNFQSSGTSYRGRNNDLTTTGLTLEERHFRVLHPEMSLLQDGTYYRTDSTKLMRGFTTIPQLSVSGLDDDGGDLQEIENRKSKDLDVKVQNFLRLYADKGFTNNLMAGYDYPFTPGAGELEQQSEHFAPPSYDSSHKDRSMKSPAVVLASPQTHGGSQFVARSPGNPLNVASPGPFLQPSPAPPAMSPSPWPGSPPFVQGSPRPGKSSMNPQTRQLLASINVSHAPIPVVLTHTAFNLLLTPVRHDHKLIAKKKTMALSPLERFFGSALLHTHLLRVLRTDDTVRENVTFSRKKELHKLLTSKIRWYLKTLTLKFRYIVPLYFDFNVNVAFPRTRVLSKDVDVKIQLKLEKKEHGVVIFSGTGKNAPDTGLQYSVRLNPSTMDSLILRITPMKGHENAWTPDELKVLEQFFENKVVCSPYKVCALTAFARILGTQPKIMKDFIKIMKLELQTDWSEYAFRVEWCLTVPPGDVPSIALPGTPAVVLKTKNLIFLQLTEVQNEDHSVTITLVHDVKTNAVQNLEFPKQPNAPQEPVTWAVRAKAALQNLLSKISEHISKKDSPIYCAVVTVLKHLQVQ